MILESMRTHKSDAKVQEEGCNALWNIGLSNNNLLQKIKDAGAEVVVRSVMSASNATSKTKAKGQQLLDRLKNA